MKKYLQLITILIITTNMSFAQYWSLSGNQSNNSSRLGTANHSPITFITNDSVRMTLSEAEGFLGIGTSTPQQLLHIHSNKNATSSNSGNGYNALSKLNSSNASLRITNKYTSITANRGFTLNLLDENLYFKLFEKGNISFYNNSKSTITLGKNNNVYIGNISYGKAKLEINGAYNKTSLLVSYSNTDTSSNTSIKVLNNNSSQTAFCSSLVENGREKENFKVLSTGFVYAREINVQITKFPDYVFDDNYHLLSYNELREYIKINKHLPNFPNAVEVGEHGLYLGETNRLLTEKIEELYLYILDLEERISELEQ